MLDQCLKFLIIVGSYSVVIRGEDYDYYEYYDGYAITTTTSTTSPPTSMTMTTNSRPTTQRIVGDNDYDLACSFGANGFCGWKNDPSANQSWLLNPLFDNDGVLNQDRDRYPFIFWDKPSPRGNSTIRLVSPLYSRVLEKNGCFSTSYIMYTPKANSGLVGIRVYQKPDYIALEDLIAKDDEAKKDYILFEVWGDWGSYFWYDKETTLKHFESNFQIILEGIFGEDPMYISISYVSITQRTAAECTANSTPRQIPKRPTTSTTISTTTTMLTTTTERTLRKNVRGEDYDYYDYYDGYAITTTTSTTSPPPSMTMTTNSRPTTQRIVGDNDYDLACSFGANGFCAWKNDPSANQSWLLNPLFDYDALLNEDTDRYPFIFWDKPSPRGNSSIRLVSPLYSRVLDKNGCFSTSFKMYKNSKNGLVGIRVYQKPDYIALEDLIAKNDEAKKDYILFEVWGDWGPYWYDKETTLKHFESNFQIILEGIFGEEPVYIAISYVSITQRTECTGNTARPIPRPTTSTTISTTTTMLTTTTERPLRKNVVDSSPASPISYPWSTTTRPSTKQPTTTQTPQEENGFDSRNTQIIISTLAILGIVLLIFVCILAVLLARQRSTYRLNDTRANIVGTSSFIDHEKKPSNARYSTKNGCDVVINCNESK